MKTRLCDIAAQAGVSSATVSNALNNRPGVSPVVAERIWEIACEMGYEPQKTRPDAERGYIRLIVYKSHGLVVMDTPFFSELIESIQAECQKDGLELVVSHINSKQDPNYRRRIRECCEEHCAGILLLATEMNEEELKPFLDSASPLLVLDNIFNHVDVPVLAINNYEAGSLATEALFDAGHRSIGHISSAVSFSNSRFRQFGYEAVIQKHGLTASHWSVTPTVEGAYADMKVLLETRNDLPTAFFADNDIMAVGCVRALTEKGYSVPEDVSMIGMDDTPLCLAGLRALSTIRVCRREMGMTAVRILRSLLPDLTTCAIKTEIGVSLVQRESVKKLI